MFRTTLWALENRLQVIHELHAAIDQALPEAEIDTAFEQWDLHIRSMAGVRTITLQDDDEQFPGLDKTLNIARIDCGAACEAASVRRGEIGNLC